MSRKNNRKQIDIRPLPAGEECAQAAASIPADAPEDPFAGVLAAWDGHMERLAASHARHVAALGSLMDAVLDEKQRLLNRTGYALVAAAVVLGALWFLVRG